MSRRQEHLAERNAQRFASTRILTPHHNEMGMAGEKALAEFFGALPDLRDLRPLPRGKRPDLEVLLDLEPPLWDWYGLDIKTTDTMYLIVEANPDKPIPDNRIYVMATYVNKVAECVKWEWGHEIKREPVGDWWSKGTRTHRKAMHRLKPIEDLRTAYRMEWRHHGLTAQPADYDRRYHTCFDGKCHCGRRGLYWTPQAWYCNEHRPAGL